MSVTFDVSNEFKSKFVKRLQSLNISHIISTLFVLKFSKYKFCKAAQFINIPLIFLVIILSNFKSNAEILSQLQNKKLISLVLSVLMEFKTPPKFCNFLQL